MTWTSNNDYRSNSLMTPIINVTKRFEINIKNNYNNPIPYNKPDELRTNKQ